MAFDWTKFVTTAIPAGIGAAGAIAGKKASNKGNANAQASIEGSYKEALDAYNRSHGQATDINNWMLSSSFAPLNFGYQQSRADLQNALLMGSDVLNPYTSAGKRGAEETNFLLYGQRPGAGGPPSTPSAGGFQPAPNFGGGFNIAPPPSLGGGAPGASSGPDNMLTSFAPHLADNRVKGSTGAGIGGLAAGVAGNFLPGGPLTGAALGAITGGLIGRLTRKGREKEAGSDAVNEHSDWFWNEIVPRAQKEGWSGDQLKQVADSSFGDYSNWINQNIKDKDVAANSVASQKKYFDEGLKSNPYTSQYYK